MIAALDLIQAEIRQARRQLLELGVAAGLLIAAAALLTVSGLLLLYALYAWLSTITPAPVAAGLCGITALIMSACLIKLAQSHVK